LGDFYIVRWKRAKRLSFDFRARVSLADRIDYGYCIAGGAIAVAGFGMMFFDHQGMATSALAAGIASVGVCLCGQLARFILERR
jgi:hypothetical protein